MKRIPFITSIIASLLLLSSCSFLSNEPAFNVWGLPKPPETGSPEYLLGWKEGCSTGMSAYTNSNLRALYKVRVTSELMKNRDYWKAWSIGNRYCQYYASSYQKMGYLDVGRGDNLTGNDVWFNRESNFFDIQKTFKSR
ncbi:MAG: hypothetical protein MK137_01280 [Rickettsiales bacterium]|nr:hypothetical protein [Rickettsiales bacterium]